MKQLLIFLCLLILAIGVDIKPADLEEIKTDTIHVTMRGAVKNKGSTELTMYTTLQEALDKAGLEDNADTSLLNPDLVLKDHDVIFVPYKKQEGEVQRISINTASKEELCTLPGIGKGTADKIIAYRSEHLFQTIEDLMKVKGIGQVKFDKLKDLITL
ncbi:MAG: ComEA family DNA-binding protein [Erysipelotrichaceae bacterium]|nr:ComEA family DNA-binding protein [Erysipelotrichaceae bacterium]